MKLRFRKRFYGLFGGLILFLSVLILPENLQVPVQGATSADWNHNTFWYEPWGPSGVHKGIDIFGVENTPVIAATSGLVVFVGEIKLGGRVVAVLGPKWRIHYYAHLNSTDVGFGRWLVAGKPLGSLGDTGNAAGKQPHVHYSIISLIPLPWLMTGESQGWKRMFYLNPHEKLLNK